MEGVCNKSAQNQRILSKVLLSHSVQMYSPTLEVMLIGGGGYVLRLRFIWNPEHISFPDVQHVEKSFDSFYLQLIVVKSVYRT
jgi:hypothetical protein